MLQSHKFTFINNFGVKSYDGPTMMMVAIEEIDLTASVNIEMHRQAIEGSKLHEFKGNVVKMTKTIEKHYQAIVDNGHMYDPETFRRHLLTAYLSGSNPIFNTKLQTVKSDVDVCYGFNAKITPSALMAMSKQLYINIERHGEWNKVDPKDARIMALTTALDNASLKKSAHTTSTTGGNNAKMTEDEFFTWRKTNQGPTAERQGKTWTWCPHHKKEGVFDGLYYCTHTPDTHDEWKAKAKRGGTSGTTKAPAKKSESQAELKISQALKNALCTNLCVSEEDLAKIIKDSKGALN